MARGTLYWSGLFLWQLSWLSQSGPSIQPSLFEWGSAFALGLLAAGAALGGRARIAPLLLLLASLLALGFASSVLFRCTAFWAYWAGFFAVIDQHRRLPSRLNRAALSLYLMSLGLQLFLVVGEVGLRALTWGKDASRYPCLSYGNTPWITGRLYRSELNSMGMREAEMPPYNLSGEKRVLFLGDSVTFGLGIPLEDTFVRRVGRDLGPAYRTLNLSSPGANLEKEFLSLATTGQFYEPNVVVWVYFPNDIEHMGWSPGFSGIEPHLDSLYKSWLFYEYLKSRYHLLLGSAGIRESYLNGIRQAYAGKPFEQFRARMAEMRFWCQRRRVKLLMVAFPFVEDLQQYPLREAHQRVLQAASELGIPSLDLLPLLEPIPTAELQLNTAFDHHPNRRANEWVAGEISRFLKQQLGVQGSSDRP